MCHRFVSKARWRSYRMKKPSSILTLVRGRVSSVHVWATRAALSLAARSAELSLCCAIIEEFWIRWKDCRAHSLNREDAMDHARWKKLMMIRMVGGWVFLLVPSHLGSPGQRAVKRLSCWKCSKFRHHQMRCELCHIPSVIEQFHWLS